MGWTGNRGGGHHWRILGGLAVGPIQETEFQEGLSNGIVEVFATSKLFFPMVRMGGIFLFRYWFRGLVDGVLPVFDALPACAGFWNSRQRRAKPEIQG